MQNSYLLGGITTNESSTAAISIRIQINPIEVPVINIIGATLANENGP